jgi:hypothetical protein
MPAIAGTRGHATPEDQFGQLASVVTTDSEVLLSAPPLPRKPSFPLVDARRLKPVSGSRTVSVAPAISLPPHRPLVEPDAPTPPKAGDWFDSSTARGQLLRRLLDVIPGGLTWLIVLSPLWASYLLPTPFAIAILVFDTYWLYLSVSTCMRAYRAHKQVEADSAKDWQKLYRAERVFRRTYLDWEVVRHVVIIPNYREDEAILSRTLESIAAQHNSEQLHVVLAIESRELGAKEKAERLAERFRHSLGGIYISAHPSGIPGEVAGKSSNEAWAARWVRHILMDREHWDLYTTTVTSCDADTVFHPSYFSCVTYKFATDPQRYRRFWQSAILLNNNIWDSPAPLRVASALAGVHIMSNLVRRSRMMFPQSTYTLSMKMADDVGFWDVDVIPEDWHMFLKCFYAFRGEVDVEPVFLPTGNDAVRSRNYAASLRMAYVQHKRHAWGSSDVSYAIVQSLAHPEIAAWRRGRRLIALMGNHLIWSTHWFILSLGWILPNVVAKILGHDHSPSWLPITARVLLWGCFVPYFSMFFLDRKYRPQKPAGWTPLQTAVDVVWWFLLPVTSLVFSTFPALDSQTRLALGKRLEYRVTEKKG